MASGFLGWVPGSNWQSRAWRYSSRDIDDFDVVYEDPIGAGRMLFLSPLYVQTPVVAVWHQVSTELLNEIHGRAVAIALAQVEVAVARIYDRCHLWAPLVETAREVVGDLRLADDRVHGIHPTLPVDSEIEALPVETLANAALRWGHSDR